ncbi:phage tail protein [Roseomonas sp. AR75]|uniref:phage tail protein n=1 Tax=Roseomonas sp. AR75 TaxID=2562311 RepID=UPI0010C047D2|nr:phage tail protein [Roseomonas sp. AR75]
MGQLAVAGGGAALGAALGSVVPGVGTLLGAQVGWALGGVAGALLFPQRGQDAQGPRLTDLTVQTSSYGVPIPVATGRAKIAGNVIWITAIEEVSSTQRQRGKGGSRGPSQTTYSYFLSWAVGLCEWLSPSPNAQLLKIWLDDKLVFDAEAATGVVQVPGLTWRFYPGDEAQLPDPLIASIEGEDAPAHRGLAYVVFERVPLDRFGNRMPNVTVELAGSAIRSFPEQPGQPPAVPFFESNPSDFFMGAGWSNRVAIDYRRGRLYEGRQRAGSAGGGADEMIRVYDLVTMQTIGEHRIDQVLGHFFPEGSAPNQSSTTAGILHVGVDGFLYMTGGQSMRVPLWKIDPDTMRGVAYFGPLQGSNPVFDGDDTIALFVPMQIASVAVPQPDGSTRPLVIVQGGQAGAVTIDAKTMSYVWGGRNATSPPAIPGRHGIIQTDILDVQLVPGATGTAGADLWHLRGTGWNTDPRIEMIRLRYSPALVITRTDFPAIDVPAEIDAGGDRPLIHHAWWDASDGTLVITISNAGSSAGPYSRYSTFKYAPGSGVVWKLVDHAPVGRFAGGPGRMERVLGSTWGLGGDLVLQTGTGLATWNANGADFSNRFWIDEQGAVIGFSGTSDIPTKRFLTRATATDLTLGDVVQQLCTRAGLAPGDINVAGLTDGLRGYVLPRPMSARDAITPLAGAFQFDAVEQDDVLVFRKRAGGVVATVPYADLVQERPDTSALSEQRAQDAELPRELTVRFLDVDRAGEPNAQSWRRPVSPTPTVAATATSTLDLPIPLTGGEAKAIARRLITATWRERTRLSFAVGPRHARLVPTDPVTLGLADGATLRCRVLSTQLGANWTTRIEAVTEDAAAYALTAPADGGSGWVPPTLPLPYAVRLLLPDLPLLLDADDLGGGGLREYALIGGYRGQAFRGATLFRSPDLLAWEELGAVTRSATWGVVTAMPAAPRSPWIWDEAGALEVQLESGALEGASALEVLNGENTAALIGVDGMAELIQFRDAADLGGGRHRLTTLLRGRRGTEDLIAARGVGDVFVLLDDALRFQAATSEIAATRHHRAPSIYETVETAAATVTKSIRGRAERPYAPAHLAGSRDEDGNLSITWIRRTRINGGWADGTGEVPLSEAAEAYEAEILDGETVVRTLSGLSAPAATYTAADQIADFGAPQASITVRVFQLSANVGRGIAARANL